jgi:general secretion pathway protein G
MNSRTINSAATRTRRGGHAARHACAGFSIVELLIAMGIFMIVSAMAVPALKEAIKSAKIGRGVADVRTIGQAALGYYAENGAAPNTLADIGYDQQLDPWGHGYQYLGFTPATGTAQMRTDRFNVPINTFFDLCSLGADGDTATSLTATQSQDDIIWANDGIYMGLASNY